MFFIIGHGTIDSFRVHFVNQEPIEIVFFNATIGKDHCKITSQFAQYVELFQKKYGQKSFFLVYIVLEFHYDNFKITSPENSEHLSAAKFNNILNTLNFAKLNVTLDAVNRVLGPKIPDS